MAISFFVFIVNHCLQEFTKPEQSKISNIVL